MPNLGDGVSMKGSVARNPPGRFGPRVGARIRACSDSNRFMLAMCAQGAHSFVPAAPLRRVA
jgi:hypothetical protein